MVTTAETYRGELVSEAGIIDTTRMDGSLNPYQTVVAVGGMCKDVAPGDIVKINFKRYAMAKHTPGAIDESQNRQFDSMSVTYEIPTVEIGGRKMLFIQSSDIEYVVTEYEVDEGGLLQ